MYSGLLVPLDGSETAERVLPYVRTLALNTPVELLAVIEISHYLHTEKARYLDTLTEAAIRSNQEYLRRIAKTFPDASVKWTVEAGAPADVIIAKAAADKQTLITMATHGRSGLNRWLLGSITEKVLRGTHNRLLVVRANEEAKTQDQVTLHSVIVPLDGSELAESVLPSVVKLAMAFKLKIMLLRSYSIKQIVDSCSYEHYFPDRNEVERRWRRVVTSYLDGKVRKLQSEGIPDVQSVVSVGEAPEAIIELANGVPNSLIVMCTHGRSGVKRWVLGSVTEKVVRHCANPVVVMRGG